MNTRWNLSLVGADPLEVLGKIGGVYRCPKDLLGNRQGPLVGYAGTYVTDDGPKHYVGDTYYNLARADENFTLLCEWAELLNVKHAHLEDIELFLGMPMGGIRFACALGKECQVRSGFLDKKIIALSSSEGREQSKLTSGRYEIFPDTKVSIVEDVVNNFSTTSEAIGVIESYGASVGAIVCMMNRSTATQFIPQSKRPIPIYSVMEVPTEQYRQGDDYVRQDIMEKNVIWKPKSDWQKMLHYMEV